ncbi:MAG: helix-turn-helix transcriptional regulator [Planctomycetes bacterium]|nr:helix-turn-helix transcriptional regulator [Planctomycetota bacterium]
MSKKKTDWQQTLRDAISSSGMSLMAIAEHAEVDHSQLSRFMRDERTLTFPTAEKIGRFLGFELKQIRKRGRHGKR